MVSILRRGKTFVCNHSRVQNMDGFILIDKPAGITSFGVVAEVRKLSREKRVGHGGTLDPLATGLLILGIGKATKKLGGLLGSNKEYEVLAQFGAVSDTYDMDGRITVSEKCDSISSKKIEDAINANFLGEILQKPPAFSAIKVNGRRAYSLARKGIEVELQARKVNIFDFRILHFNWPEVSFLVSCVSGTDIRSLIHDLGQLFGCGAFVKELRRTKIADYKVTDAVTLDKLTKENIAGFLL